MSVVTKYDGHAFSTSYTVTILAGMGKSLPAMKAQMVSQTGRWPLLGGLVRAGHTLVLGIAIEGSNEETLREQLFQWFDPEDEDPKELTITDDDGASNPRYVNAVCLGIQPQRQGGGRVPRLYTADMMVHGDVRWREDTPSTDSWSITASGQTKAVTNAGEDYAYPILKIKPTSAKTGGYGYKRWVAVRWRIAQAASGYPYELSNGGFDTASLVSGGKAQADGDDFRVEVDGSHVDRWFGTGSNAFNQAATKIWVNLDFEANISLTLKTAIAGSGVIDEIEVNESISNMPSAGIVLIDSEAFVYTSKNDTDKALQGVTRTAKGTSIGAHSASAAVYWIQHDIWYLYGNATATAPSIDDDYKPAFTLDSVNTLWQYDDCGDDNEKRAASWTRLYYGVGFGKKCYTGNRATSATPWADIGIEVYGDDDYGWWYLHNPCEMTNANFQNGEKYQWKDPAVWEEDEWRAEVQTSSDGITLITEYEIPEPSTAQTWEAWSQNQALTSGSKYVCLFHLAQRNYMRYPSYVEVADVQVTLDSSNVPTTALTTSEQGNYSLECLITNNTTGDAIGLQFTMELNEELKVDTDAKTVVYLKDNSSQMQTLSLVGGPRRRWLPLADGSNTLQFDDSGTNAVTIALEWEERYYD